jgi:hypothetical protein
LLRAFLRLRFRAKAIFTRRFSPSFRQLGVTLYYLNGALLLKLALEATQAFSNHSPPPGVEPPPKGRELAYRNFHFLAFKFNHFSVSGYQICTDVVAV